VSQRLIPFAESVGLSRPPFASPTVSNREPLHIFDHKSGSLAIIL
jgi:hypothetical protein